MKRTMIVLMMLAAFFIGTATVGAMPYIEVEGFVDPNSGIKTVNGDKTTFSQIDYFFIVKDTMIGAEMNYVSLEFEDDVFFDIGSVAATIPGDWTTGLLPCGTCDGGSGSIYEMASAGTTLGLGEILTISMQDVVVYTDALFNDSLWQEGQVWGQSWLAKDTMNGGDGGSTAPVPEPGTLLLLGTGLAGISVYTRRKKLK